MRCPPPRPVPRCGSCSWAPRAFWACSASSPSGSGPLPPDRRYEGWSFRSFEEGCEAFRRLEQEGSAPDVARLSDEEETRLTMTLSSSGSAAERAGLAYLRLRGHEGGCIVIVGFEGAPDDGRAAPPGAPPGCCAPGAGWPWAARPGRAWLRNRFATPYLRDELLDRGVMIETLETAATWSGLGALYEAVGGRPARLAVRAAARRRS